MKKLGLLLFLAFSGLSVFAQNGTTKGTIYDEVGLSLPGVNVYIPALAVGVATDVNGTFVLVDVPTGEHTLSVTYIGYESQETTVKVEEGTTSTTTLYLKPGMVIGEEILVLGDRLKGQAKAINQQKNNANITNILAADQIGRFPNANIGDAVKRG